MAEKSSNIMIRVKPAFAEALAEFAQDESNKRGKFVAKGEILVSSALKANPLLRRIFNEKRKGEASDGTPSK